MKVWIVEYAFCGDEFQILDIFSSYEKASAWVANAKADNLECDEEELYSYVIIEREVI